MVKFHSGLEELFAKQELSLKGAPDVVISERRDVKILQLSFFLQQQTALKKQLALFGISDVPKFSQIKTGKKASAARVEMEKIWLIRDEKPEQFSDQISEQISGPSLGQCDDKFYPLELSSARNIIRVTGRRAPDVMARICAVDFRDKSRSFYATSIHHVGVHIHHHDDGFDIYMPRSFAVSLAEMIITISRQYNVQMA